MTTFQLETRGCRKFHRQWYSCGVWDRIWLSAQVVMNREGSLRRQRWVLVFHERGVLSICSWVLYSWMRRVNWFTVIYFPGAYGECECGICPAMMKHWMISIVVTIRGFSTDCRLLEWNLCIRCMIFRFKGLWTLWNRLRSAFPRLCILCKRSPCHNRQDAERLNTKHDIISVQSASRRLQLLFAVLVQGTYANSFWYSWHLKTW